MRTTGDIPRAAQYLLTRTARHRAKDSRPMTKKKSPPKRRDRRRKSVPEINRPLSEREIEELSAYFASAYAPDDCMPISMLHGFLSAVLSGPVVMPNEWLPRVWGEEEPGFESEAQMRRIIGLLMRFYNGIAAEFARNPLRFEPLLDITVQVMALNRSTPRRGALATALAWSLTNTHGRISCKTRGRPCFFTRSCRSGCAARIRTTTKTACRP